MSWSIAPGVRVIGLSPQALLGFLIAGSVLERHGYDVALTSGSEGKHTAGSRHYVGDAVDIRNRHIPEDRRAALRDEIAAALGVDYLVLNETNPPHFHVQYSPQHPY